MAHPLLSIQSRNNEPNDIHIRLGLSTSINLALRTPLRHVQKFIVSSVILGHVVLTPGPSHQTYSDLAGDSLSRLMVGSLLLHGSLGADANTVSRCWKSSTSVVSSVGLLSPDTLDNGADMTH